MYFDRLNDSPEREAAAARLRADELRNTRFIRLGLVMVLLLLPILYVTLSGQTSFASVKAAIRERATVEHSDDFRGGFARWQPSAAQTWAIDPAGSVRPNALALFKPTLGLADYQFEFLSQIENRSLDFVVRAVDERNYWAGRVSLVTQGPNPKVTIAHWAVVDGVQREFRELPIPMTFRPDALLRVWVGATGERMQVAINGQLCDYWDDTLFKKGGVGFMSEKGATFRVISLRVWDKDDFLGQLCSRLSPISADSKLPVER